MCQTPYIIAIGVLSGLAFLTKSWIGVALLCAPPVLASMAMREWDVVKRVLPRAFAASVIGIVVIGGPWVYALAHTDGAGWKAVKSCLVDEYVGRTVGGADLGKRGHAHWPGYYIPVVLYTLAPWILAIPAAIKARTFDRSRHGGRTLWLALLFASGVVLLSIPSGKRELYLVPLMPAVSVVAGTWLSRVGSRRAGAWDQPTAISLGAVFAFVIVAVSAGAMYVAASLPLPESLDFRTRALLTVAARGAVGIVVPVVAAMVVLHLRRRAGASTARTTVVLAAVAFLVLHAGLRPMIDAFRDMSSGARQLEAMVPADRRLLAFSADETTLAVVPFYSSTHVYLDNEDDLNKALARLRSVPQTLLVVMDTDVHKLTPAARKELELVETVRLSATRDVNVYRYRP